MIPKIDTRSDQDIIEDIMVPHLVQVTLGNIARDGKAHVPDTWMELLSNSMRVGFKGLDMLTAQRVAKQMDKDSSSLFRVASVSTYTELALSVSMMVLDLVETGVYKNVQSQAVLIASKIVTEAMEYGDMGDISVCKTASDKLRNHLNFLGYYNDRKVVLH